jgi:hypothetical protein
MEMDIREDGDRELAALRKVQEALSALDEGAARRVIQWASDRYHAGLTASFPAHARSDATMPAIPQDVADLYHSAAPRTEYEKALVAAYWLHRVRGQSDLDAQQVNGELKQLGFGVRNITVAFADLMRRKPQLAIQTGKAGTSKQARKRYRLTAEGLRVVESMVKERRSES